jgi:predicted DNA-binding protein YlxM (UPF0122 family)
MRQKKSIEQLAQTINKQTFIEYYNSYLSIDAMANKTNICRSHVCDLIKYWGLTRNLSKVKSFNLSNSEAKQANFNNIISRITKDAIYQWYIIEDHDYSEAPAYFNINRSMFDKLCRYYNIKKDKSKSRYKGLQTAAIKYGSNNANNWIKAQQTRIQNYGSLEESYKQGFEKIKQTNLKRYGSEIIFNMPNIASHINKEYTEPNEAFRHKLETNNIVYSREFVIGTKAYDFKVDDCLIEINPTITHNADWLPFGNHIGKENNYHLSKTKLADDNGYRCIHVWDWDNYNKILTLLLPRDTIYARKCIVKPVDNHDAENYCNEYHLQNYAKCSVRLGLYYNDELVSLMTFGKPRYNKNYEWELIRYCAHKNVIGGDEKLFKHFIQQYKPKSIISYCDNSKFRGTTYIKLGFKLKSKGIPTCHWYNIKTKEHYTDALIRKEGFSRIIHHCEPSEDKNLTTDSNRELMLQAGFLRVFDCGQSVWIYNSL